MAADAKHFMECVAAEFNSRVKSRERASMQTAFCAPDNIEGEEREQETSSEVSSEDEQKLEVAAEMFAELFAEGGAAKCENNQNDALDAAENIKDTTEEKDEISAVPNSDSTSTRATDADLVKAEGKISEASEGAALTASQDSLF